MAHCLESHSARVPARGRFPLVSFPLVKSITCVTWSYASGSTPAAPGALRLGGRGVWSARTL